VLPEGSVSAGSTQNNKTRNDGTLDLRSRLCTGGPHGQAENVPTLIGKIEPGHCNLNLKKN